MENKETEAAKRQTVSQEGEKPSDLRETGETAEVNEKAEKEEENKEKQEKETQKAKDKEEEQKQEVQKQEEQNQVQEKQTQDKIDRERKKEGKSKETEKTGRKRRELSRDQYRKKRRFLQIGLGAALVLTAGLYLGTAWKYRRCFLPNTYINGINCSDLTVEEAEERIRESVEGYAIDLVFRDGSEETISGSSIGYHYETNSNIQQFKEKQNPLAWIVGFFRGESFEFTEDCSYEEDMLRERISSLNELSDENQIPPTDAYLTYRDDCFVIVPENPGNQIDENALFQCVKEAIDAGEDNLDLDKCDVYEKPAVCQDSQELANQREQLNQLVSVSVTYDLPKGKKILDGNTVKSWVSVNEEGQYFFDQEELQQHAAEFVAELAEETDTVGKERTFHATLQGDITVSGGPYGWHIDQEAETAQLIQDISNHAIVEREPVYCYREVTPEGNGIGNKYIEIDMTNQHLWYYIDGNLYLETDVVTGKGTDPARKTPAGVYLMYYKQQDKVLRGEKREDGTYEYEVEVKYWMPFNGAIGLHDAPWNPMFGGDYYMEHGSHGCVNLPAEIAENIYQIIDTVTPIICYY